MSNRNDLNKTWTILPDDEEAAESSGESESNAVLSNTFSIDHQASWNDDGNISLCSPSKSCDQKPRTLVELFGLNDAEFESLFDQNFLGLEFENGDPIITSNPPSPKRPARRSTFGGSTNRRRRSTRAQLNVTIDIETSPTRPEVTTEAKSEPANDVMPTSTSASSLSSTSTGNDCPPTTQASEPVPIAPIDDFLQPSFDARSVPKTFDLFLNDIRKSSSTLDIHATTADVSVASADEPPLNRTFKISPKATATAAMAGLNPCSSLNHGALLAGSVENELNAIVEQSRPGLNQANPTTFRSKLASVPQPASWANKVCNPKQVPSASQASRMPRPSTVFMPTTAIGKASPVSSTSSVSTAAKASKLVQPTVTTSIPRVSSISKAPVAAKSSPTSGSVRQLTNSIESNARASAFSIPTSSNLNRLSSVSSSSSTSQSSTKENKSAKPAGAASSSSPLNAKSNPVLGYKAGANVIKSGETSSANGIVSKLKPPSVVNKASLVGISSSGAATVNGLARTPTETAKNSQKIAQPSKIPSIPKTSRPISSAYGL